MRVIESNGHGLTGARMSLRHTVVAARYQLTCSDLPRVERTIRVGNLFRLALMSLGPDDSPQHLSGKDERGHALQLGHAHSFFLPEDSDGDGFLDHLLFWSNDPVSPEVMNALNSLECLYSRGDLALHPVPLGGRPHRWPVSLQAMGSRGMIADLTRALRGGETWVSSTPYFHPWHRKRHGKFGVSDQVRREAKSRGLPELREIEIIAEPNSGSVKMVSDFTQARYRFGFDILRGSEEAPGNIPDRNGRYLRLTFAEPISGPLALGYGCHYGLGLFQPIPPDPC